VIRLTARRFSSNRISTVTNQGKVRWMIYRDTLNSAVFIRFLERLVAFLIATSPSVTHMPFSSVNRSSARRISPISERSETSINDEKYR